MKVRLPGGSYPRKGPVIYLPMATHWIRLDLLFPFLFGFLQLASFLLSCCDQYTIPTYIVPHNRDPSVQTIGRLRLCVPCSARTNFRVSDTRNQCTDKAGAVHQSQSFICLGQVVPGGCVESATCSRRLIDRSWADPYRSRCRRR